MDITYQRLFKDLTILSELSTFWRALP